MNLGIIKHLNICDLTSRLPGPMASYILATQGANILKLENSDFDGDHFSSKEIKSTDPYFYDWYQELNKNKKILQISFNNEEVKLKKSLNESDIIIAPSTTWADNILKKVSSLKPKVIIQIGGSKGEHKAMHDLNALAKTKTFQHQLKYTKSLPYLPFAGIAFGQYIATTALSLYIKSLQTQSSQKQSLYLDEVTSEILDTLKSKNHHRNGQFLHTGSYPCYEIYSSKDNYALCLAAVEKKFWLNLLKCLELPLTSEDRFDTTGKIKKILQDKFLKLSAEEIEMAIAKRETCLTIAR